MRKIQSVKTGKYVAVCLLLVLLAVLTVGCTNGNTGNIDPDVIEHNPNQPVSASDDESWNSEAEVGEQAGTNQESREPAEGNQQPEMPDTASGDETGKNEENSESTGKNDSTDTGTTEPDKRPDVENTDEPIEPEVVVVLDPGHGGRFSGAVHGLVEKDTVLKIALYAKSYLEKNYPQIEVKMTRETDKDFDAQLAKDLENRVQLGKELGADVFVSFHLNASVAHNIRGAEVICPHREHVKTDSVLLGNCILDELTALGIKRRGIVTKNSNDMVDANGNPLEYYAINRHAANRDMIGIIVEHCFMDNEEDKVFLADEAALQRLGEADARGIAAYFGY